MMPRLTPRKNPNCRATVRRRRTGFNDAEAHASEEPVHGRRTGCRTTSFNDAEAHASEEPGQPARQRTRPSRFNDAEAHASEEPVYELSTHQDDAELQ